VKLEEPILQSLMSDSQTTAVSRSRLSDMVIPDSPLHPYLAIHHCREFISTRFLKRGRDDTF